MPSQTSFSSTDSELPDALAAFMALVQQTNVSREVLIDQLRYPRHEASPVSGSELASQLWNSDEGRQLIGVLRSDPPIAKWFRQISGIPHELVVLELQRHVASVLDEWLLSGTDRDTAASGLGLALLDELRNPLRTTVMLRILHGVEVAERIDFEDGVALEPATPEVLHALLTQLGAVEREILRLPAGPAAVVVNTVQASRDSFGHLAATTAYAASWVGTENAKWDAWLATGILPRPGSAYVYELSRFPALPPEHFRSSMTARIPFADRGNPTIEPELITPIHVRMGALRHGVGDKGAVPMVLWVADSYIHSALDAADDLFVVAWCHAALEGLLIRKGESSSLLGRRLTPLIAANPPEGRHIRKIVPKWKQIRDFGAHGERPDDAIVARFVEAPIDDRHPSGMLAGDYTLWKSASRRATALLRRAYLACLYCMVWEDGQSLRIGLSRDEVLDLLDSAHSGDDGARRRLAEYVPPIALQQSL